MQAHELPNVTTSRSRNRGQIKNQAAPAAA